MRPSLLANWSSSGHSNNPRACLNGHWPLMSSLWCLAFTQVVQAVAGLLAKRLARPRFVDNLGSIHSQEVGVGLVWFSVRAITVSISLISVNLGTQALGWVPGICRKILRSSA